MEKPTITEINQSGVLGEYFFLHSRYSLEPLHFFGKAASSFRTDWHNKDKGILRIYATIEDKHGQELESSERFIDVNNWVQVTA